MSIAPPLRRALDSIAPVRVLTPPLRGALASLAAASSFRIVAPLTAAYTLAYLVSEVLESLRVPLIGAGLVAAAGAALLRPALARTPWLWAVMAALLACVLAQSWMLVDNHVFLAGYWMVALAAARSAPEDRRAPALARAASALVGLTMLFATLHKVRSPEFMSGDFFHLTFVTEARFAPLGWLAGQDLGQISGANIAAIAALKSDPTRAPIALEGGGASVRELATAMSALVVASELLLAVLWLARWQSRAGRLVRHGALLAFAIGTYAIAPVPGFGAILMILGLADTRPGDGALRAAYLAVILHVLFGAALVRTLTT